MTTWTPRPQTLNDSIFSTDIQPPDPRYTPFVSTITPQEDGYYPFVDRGWNTPYWQVRS